MIEEEKVRWPSKKKYPCKRLKGAHQFEVIKVEEIDELSNFVKQMEIKRIIHSKCIGCGKKDVEYVHKLNKKDKEK